MSSGGPKRSPISSLGDWSGDDKLQAIADFAAELCATSTALVSIVEEHRQRFLVRTNCDLTETPRAQSFCAHALARRDVLVVPDATEDPRFADNPLVTGEPFIRFYAGAPLVSAEGITLGTLCVIDPTPRAALTSFQERGLRLLAAHVMALLESLRTDRRHRLSESESRQALSEQEDRFRILADTMPQMVWSTLPNGFHDYYNARWYEFTGVPVGSTDGEGWNGMFHPDDQTRAWERWRHSLATGEPYEIEYRLRDASGAYRWTLGRALPMRDAEGAIIRWFGTCTDIHDQKLLAEQREIVSHELSHRIKNIFSVISGMISYSVRARPQLAEIADDLRSRIMALGRAHDYVRPHSERSRPDRLPNRLHGMLEQLLSPYRRSGDEVVIMGDDIGIDDRSATPLALFFHEVATNAAKYGALSTPSGRVAIAVRREPHQISIDWTETGGPPITVVPSESGFGSQLMEMSLVRQLGGTISRQWMKEGLRISVAIPAAAMARDAPRAETA